MISSNYLLRRQQVLAEFGAFAQKSDDLDEVLTRACHLVGEALGTDLAKVLEIEEDTETLFVRAGVGWQPGVVGEVRLPMGGRSSENYAIETGKPVLCSDIEKEERFAFPGFMREAGVVGMVNVPIFLHGRKAYGLLQVDSRHVWAPDEVDQEFLLTYATILGPVIDRLHKIHALRLATDRNRTLLRELQHRIKNNIGSITALIDLQLHRASSDDVRKELMIVADRVETLRLVHEMVYASGDGDLLPLRPYVTRLLNGLLSLYVERPVRLDMEFEDIRIGSDLAIPIGLILNEFVTNSLKYAWPGEGGAQAVISVAARMQGDRLSISIADNGRGFGSDATPGGTPGGVAAGKEPTEAQGTGMSLIEGLSAQIRATATWASVDGTSLSLSLGIGG